MYIFQRWRGEIGGDYGSLTGERLLRTITGEPKVNGKRERIQFKREKGYIRQFIDVICFFISWRLETQCLTLPKTFWNNLQGTDQCNALIYYVRNYKVCFDTLCPSIKASRVLKFVVCLSVVTRPTLGSLGSLAHATTWVVLLIPMRCLRHLEGYIKPYHGTDTKGLRYMILKFWRLIKASRFLKFMGMPLSSD